MDNGLLLLNYCLIPTVQYEKDTSCEHFTNHPANFANYPASTSKSVNFLDTFGYPLGTLSILTVTLPPKKNKHTPPSQRTAKSWCPVPLAWAATPGR